MDVTLFQQYLRVNNLALVVGQNVTKRDRADKEQPYNPRIAGTANVTVGTNSGKTYDLGRIQFIQADRRRGFTANTTQIQPGRRVLPTPLHEIAADNVVDPTGPTGSLKLGDDGSLTVLVPTRRAMTWQLMGTNGMNMTTKSIVKERFWVTFRPGEIRTCKNCHGINTADQAGNPPPNNEAQIFHDLLRYWNNNTPFVSIASNGGGNFLSLWFKRRLGVSNLTNAVQISQDMVNWTNGSVYSATGNMPKTMLTSEVSRNATNNETIVVCGNSPISSARQQFMRVRVTSP